MEDWQRKYYANKMMNSQMNSTPITKPSNTCRIRNGAMLYRPIDANGFGTTAVFVIPYGPIPENLIDREFEFKADRTNCYLLESQTSVIDTGKLNERTSLSLIKISAPFIGTCFVQENAIIRNPHHANMSGQTILKG